MNEKAIENFVNTIRSKYQAENYISYHDDMSTAFKIIEQLQAELEKQPEPGAFTKDFRQWLADNKLSMGCAVWTKANEACDIIDRQAKEKRQQAKRIVLLQECDDTSTKTIGEMDEELEQKDAEIRQLKERAANG